MDERMRFVIRLKDGESMASLCREFGISRKTRYKIFERYEECGLEGLSDRARRPFRYPRLKSSSYRPPSKPRSRWSRKSCPSPRSLRSSPKRKS